VKRIGRDRFLRNVLIAIGNSGEVTLAEEARRLLGDESALVRGAAVWALGQLLSREKFTAMKNAALGRESDESVREEWKAAS
jgi:epoxyqueuosine reductase